MLQILRSSTVKSSGGNDLSCISRQLYYTLITYNHLSHSTSSFIVIYPWMDIMIISIYRLYSKR
nr:MAG: VP2 protein [Drosophila Dalkeith chuvirus]